MATGGHEMDFNKETEYNATLYKTILNPFLQCMPPVQLSESNFISRLLSVEEMERVRRKYETEGQNASARLLLDFLKMKHKWFPAFMKALEEPHLKLQEHKQKFLILKQQVDQEWQKKHPNTSSPQLRSPVQSSTPMGLDSTTFKTPVPDSAAGTNVPPSDFNIETPGLRVSNVEAPTRGLVTDAEEELDRPRSEANLESQMAGMALTQERPFVHSKSYPGSGTAGASGGVGKLEEDYRDAASPSQYDVLGSPSLPSEYDELSRPKNRRSLQTDACPIVEQESGAPEEEVGEEAQPQLQNPRHPQRRRPQTRQDHPSLRVAISNNPRKDFEANFVRDELQGLDGWQNFQEEHEVIQLVRPNRRNEGTYVIWYWALAKRPTICVLLRGKVITFVVHKSASQTNKFYINRQQKRSSSLRDLMTYHLRVGIKYKPSREDETIVWLLQPAT
ncbi:uncharacterized protein [Littorina saxatilis]|uniref:Caspase recruitment domain-containing protein n=1 Tax=Littorina saxatilis TaxID=31220 RepID=A0AAN9BC70_9CAEN